MAWSSIANISWTALTGGYINIGILKYLVSQNAVQNLFCIAWKATESWGPPIWLPHYITWNPSFVCESAGWQSKDYHNTNSDLAVLPHSCLIFPSQIQRPLSSQKACSAWSENTQSGDPACAVFVLSHSYSALPYLCLFFSSSSIFSLLVCAKMRLGWAGSLYGRVSL